MASEHRIADKAGTLMYLCIRHVLCQGIQCRPEDGRIEVLCRGVSHAVPALIRELIACGGVHMKASPPRFAHPRGVENCAASHGMQPHVPHADPQKDTHNYFVAQRIKCVTASEPWNMALPQQPQ